MNKIFDNLWLGDIQDARLADLTQFNTIITVCPTKDQLKPQLNPDCSHLQFPLCDGEPPEGLSESDIWPDCKWEYQMFKTAVDKVVNSLNTNKTTFVHCNAGQSRSVGVCAAALSTYMDIPLTDAIDEIGNSRTNINPSPDVIEFAERYSTENR
jgi:protein-tyrosine phosphatase